PRFRGSTFRGSEPPGFSRGNLSARALGPDATATIGSGLTDLMSGRRRAVLALLLFAGLAVLHTWPVASSPAHVSLNHNADAQLCEWTLSWIAHILPTHPSHLFDGNIFAP